MAHTKGLLEVSSRSFGNADASVNINLWAVGGGSLVATARTVHEGSVNAESNAARLAACWNACDGLNPEAVKDMLAALKGLVQTVETSGYGDGMHRCLLAARAAIAKAQDA